MPENACAVPLRKWLCPSLLESYNPPEGSDVEAGEAGPAMAQCRACLRRMARARLLRILTSNSGTQRLASEVFAVAKDRPDRFVGDRRCQTERERLIHRAGIPYAPRLKRILLKKGSSLPLNPRDVRDCSYLFQVDDKRLRKQIIGLRVPESWFNNLDDEAQDFLLASTFKPWLSSDLTRPPNKASRTPGYVQVAIAGNMMGDKNAVAALQDAHRRQLLSCGALT